MNNVATNTTHLLWVGRWVEVCRSSVDIGDGPEPAWTFKSGRDAASWLLYPREPVVGQQKEKQ